MIYKLQPILKHRLWGGNNLAKIYHKATDDKIGEAWILSCINDDNSPINNRQTLLTLFKRNPNIVAKGYRGAFPLLIKLIDAQDDLSIQVHPSIKTEFWHILNSLPSKLYMGLNQDSDKKQIENLLKKSQITTTLNHVDVKAGDSYLINPGTIHAIGKKTFLIEIQQSADITYRLYDFNRVDSNGKHRELHINQALECIDYKNLEINQTNNQEHLVNCPFFNVYKYQIKDKIQLNATDKSFHAIVVLNGSGKIKTNDKTLAFSQYETFFVPASTGQYEIDGQATVIHVTL